MPTPGRVHLVMSRRKLSDSGSIGRMPRSRNSQTALARLPAGTPLIENRKGLAGSGWRSMRWLLCDITGDEREHYHEFTLVQNQFRPVQAHEHDLSQNEL